VLLALLLNIPGQLGGDLPPDPPAEVVAGAADDEGVDPYLTRRELAKFARGARIKIREPEREAAALPPPVVAPAPVSSQTPPVPPLDTSGPSVAAVLAAQRAAEIEAAAEAARVEQAARLAAQIAQDDEDALAVILAIAANRALVA